MDDWRMAEVENQIRFRDPGQAVPRASVEQVERLMRLRVVAQLGG